ncbi:microspherule protein 1-like [Melospiza melodia melodia]|uniref:microspherule protein 1-like n=1 Tax=Melospiza melodia melodia TaxID=1914991 RepID=UPI002FD0F4A1
MAAPAAEPVTSFCFRRGPEVAPPWRPGAAGADATMATSRSEDEESLAGPKRGPATPVGTVPKRRSSSRFIKCRKFDDELVESSLAKPASPSQLTPVHPSSLPVVPSPSQLPPSGSQSLPVAPSPSQFVFQVHQASQVRRRAGRVQPGQAPQSIPVNSSPSQLTPVHPS